MNLFRKGGLLLAALVSFVSVAATPDVKDFVRHSEFHNVKISPDGKHLAVLMNNDGGKSLAFLNTKTLQPVFALKADRKDLPENFYWVNDERVVVQVGRSHGSLEKPFVTGELFAINYDGSKARMIAGYRSKGGMALSADAYFLLDNLDGDEKHILMYRRTINKSGGALPEVVKLNVYNGRERKIKRAPVPYGSFLIDNHGVPRFATGMTSDGKTKLYYSPAKGEDWELFKDEFAGEFEPLGFSSDNDSVYVLQSEDGGTKGLYQYNLKTGKSSELYRSEIADPTYAISSNLNEVYGLRMDEDFPTYLFIKPDTKEAQVHKALVGAFNGDAVEITSKTRDGKQMVVWVNGDRNPGAFYLVDTDKLSARFLLAARPWLKADQLAMTEPFRLKTPDGLQLNGYLTLPQGKQKDLPTIVMPHGGPHARDYWGFHPDAQMLASQGYAVVQVNFRGSTGYGQRFEQAGWGEWGNKIQDDITLATQYAIQSGVADKDRICIYGASFGGYSALQSAIREPELYKCAIGYVGVYDLPMLYDEGDIRSIKWGDAYLDKTLGTDVASQQSQSPARNVDKLKAPVLIVHGEDDERAHIEHAYALRDALDKKGHPYEWLVKDKEGHGFYNEENILEMYQTMLRFLDTHIGKGTPAN
ncbi:S9 family peptidase [Shewanella corallii]|uniref:S9 family peptidase n=1 Tax=Shewanella corallii TaxID=560080 RepID=A0ABT0N350_9GAMM|nr:S9 family peptidase [Shewanella corallii]MCL2912873.1 S9 family peptidase [Shewanella corallii]